MNLSKVGLYLALCCLLLSFYSAGGNYHFYREEFNDPIELPDDGTYSKFDEILLKEGKAFYDEVDPYHKQLEKRGVKAVLFGVTLFLALTNVGTDIFLGNGGCCMIQKTKDKDACDKIEKIKNMATDLATTGKQMDQEYLESQKAMSYLEELNNNNAMFRVEIRRLRDLEEEIIETIDPKLVNEFKDKVGKIKELLDKGKEQTSTSNIDVAPIYEPLYKTWQGRAYLFGSVGLQIIGELGELAFDRAVINNIRKDIDPELHMRIALNKKTTGGGAKAKRLLGGTDSIDDLSKSMAKTKRRMNDQQLKQKKMVSRFSKGLSVLGIAFELYELFNKFKTCSDSYAKVKKTEETVTKALAAAKQTLKEIQGNRTEISNQYLIMKSALQADKVLQTVGAFHDFVTKASPAARRRMRTAEVNLDVFNKYIKVESPSLTSSLQTLLINGLRTIEIKYKCLLARYEAVARIGSDCKLGSGTFDVLYQKTSQEIKLHKCVTSEGEPFTSVEQMKEFIKIDSTNSTDKKDWYNPNCLLNSKHLVNNLCRKKCVDGFEYTKVLEGHPTITVDELKKLCEPDGKCPELPLTPAEKLMICGMKGNNIPLGTIQSIMKKHSAEKVKKAYDECT